MVKLIIGIIIGMVLGIFGTALAATSSLADERMDEMTQKKGLAKDDH